MTVTQEPFTVRLDGGVLELVLDTPGCSHNILNLEAAAQLSRILNETDPQFVRVIVIKSGKPASFINGVGLLMAGTAQEPDDIPAMTQEVTRAYRALRDFPAPSVAAIAGNCYGCGVEFALHCDYRLACEGYETHFYMTELVDYLFLPAFGATQDLPRLLGMEKSVDLLLWGERWSARQAAAYGLVDRCFDAQTFDRNVAKFSRALAAAPCKRAPRLYEPWGPTQVAHEVVTHERIATLPPAYQSVYRTAYELMRNAAQKASPSPDDYAHELQACSESIVRPIAKAAVAFFFVRQLAIHYCLRSYELPQLTHIAIDPADDCLSDLRREFITRRVRGLDVVDSSASESQRFSSASSGGFTLEFMTVADRGTVRPDVIGAIMRPRERLSERANCIVYSPFFASATSRLVEIACDRSQPSLLRTAVVAVFDRAGYCPVQSHPQGEFATNLLLGHYLAPLLAFVVTGGKATDAHATLREFGFIRGGVPLLQAIPHGLLCRLTAPLLSKADPTICAAATELASTNYRTGVMRTELLDAVLTSLAVFAIEAVSSGVVPHPALVDVMARELIDFPLMHGSLCRFMNPAERARLRERTASLNSLFSPEFSARAARCLAQWQRFYNGTADDVAPAATASVAPQAHVAVEDHREWIRRASRL
jgi:enoyl-CoA hydratase/carnithine racemase